MKAIIFNLLAWVMLPIMDGFAKYLSADLPVLQITWARYFFTVAFTFPIMFFFYRNQLKWSDKPKLQIIRGLILLIANICFFYSISVRPKWGSKHICSFSGYNFSIFQKRSK